MTAFRHRVRRRLTAVFAVLALLCAQTTLASYLCPTESAAQEMERMMEAGAPCEGMDVSQPTLCHQYCADDGATVESLKLPTAAQPALVARSLRPLMVLETERPVLPAATPTGRPPPRPLFLSTLRVRV